MKRPQTENGPAFPSAFKRALETYRRAGAWQPEVPWRAKGPSREFHGLAACGLRSSGWRRLLLGCGLPLFRKRELPVPCSGVD